MFTALRYRGPGTDLSVGLIEGARWMAGRERPHGQAHAPNLPTEEVFTSPHRSARGHGAQLDAARPARHVVEGLELRLAGGAS